MAAAGEGGGGAGHRAAAAAAAAAAGGGGGECEGRLGAAQRAAGGGQVADLVAKGGMPAAEEGQLPQRTRPPSQNCSV